jgi:beta-aspartyl-dipeptidase (metallo-type)
MHGALLRRGGTSGHLARVVHVREDEPRAAGSSNRDGRPDVLDKRASDARCTGYGACRAPLSDLGGDTVITLIENAEVYAPAPLGRQSVLVLGDTIAKIGTIDRRAADALEVDYEVIDANGCVLCPGLIDPHQHLLGGSGEEGFSTMTPEIFLEELVGGGTTTVIGCLGVDVTMRNMAALAGKAKALAEDGLDALLWTGGYRVPPATLSANARTDILFVQEIIGVGEVAISDERGSDPEPRELAKLVHEARVAGMLARKSGLTHFHVGNGKARLAPLRQLIDDFHVQPSWLYATHVERNEGLMREAIDLARAGAHIDVDIVEEDLPRWLRFYEHHDGDFSRLTVSSDASISSPRMLLQQLRCAVLRHRVPLERALALATENTARALQLARKGQIAAGKAADVLVLAADTLDVVHVHARGGWMVRDGSLMKRSHWLENSKRAIHMTGTKAQQRGQGGGWNA